MNAIINHYDRPKNQFKQASQQNVKERKQIKWKKLQKIHHRLNELKKAVNGRESFVKRGLGNRGSKMLNWLFSGSKHKKIWST